MAEPFQRRAETGAGLVGSLLGRRKKSDCLREIEDLFARAERLTEVSPRKVSEIADRHELDFSERLRTARRCLYRRFLQHCLEDQTFTEEEREEVGHLRDLLRLDARDAGMVHEQVAQDIYGAALDRVLQDFRLDPEEEEFLERLRADLELPDEVAEALREEKTRQAKQRFLSQGAVHEHALVAGRRAVFEVQGRSERGLEDAIRTAVEEAHRTVPEVAVAELRDVQTELEDGRIASWNVTVRMALDHPQGDPENEAE